jgi:phosphoglycolate phosphatase-like HAD superfamily hydrolase
MSELEAEGKISGVVNSSDVENSKPAPDILELTLEEADTSPDETVAVGDAVQKIELANAAGIRTVAVLTGGACSDQELKEARRRLGLRRLRRAAGIRLSGVALQVPLPALRASRKVLY